jgi:hypothetical protein
MELVNDSISNYSSVSTAKCSTRWTTDESGLNSQHRQEIFLSTVTFRLAMGPTQPLILWASGIVSPRAKQPGCEADHSPQSNVKVKNREAVCSLFHMSSWHSA